MNSGLALGIGWRIKKVQKQKQQGIRVLYKRRSGNKGQRTKSIKKDSHVKKKKGWVRGQHATGKPQKLFNGKWSFVDSWPDQLLPA